MAVQVQHDRRGMHFLIEIRSPFLLFTGDVFSFTSVLDIASGGVCVCVSLRALWFKAPVGVWFSLLHDL